MVGDDFKRYLILKVTVDNGAEMIRRKKKL